MAGIWNPNAGTLGLEWFPVYRALVNIFSGPFRAQVLRSTSAQTVTALRHAIGPVQSQGNPLRTLVDVYPLASLIAAPPVPYAVTSYAPNADGFVSGWTNQAGSGTNLWQSIDDPVQYPPLGTDRIRTFSTTPAEYRFHVASGAFPLTARVHRLNIQAVIGREAVSGSAGRQFAFRLYYVPTATFYSPTPNLWAPYFGQLVTIDCGEINPQSGLPWSPQDIREFDGGNWQVRVESVATAACGSQIPTIALQVYSTDPDPRVAVGAWARPAGAPGPLVTTDALVRLSAGAWVADWLKANAQDYAFLWRYANAKAVTGTATLAQDIQAAYAGAEVGTPASQPSPVPGMHSRIVTVDSLGRPTSVSHESNLNARLDLIVAGAVADDSQPYRIDTGDTITQPSKRDVAPSGTYIAQRMTPAANQSYLGVRFVCRPPTKTFPDADSAVLEVTVNRVSDGLQMGGSLVLAAPQVRAGQEMPNAPGWHYVEGFLSAGAALIAGTQYEVRFTPTAGPPNLPWSLMAGRQDGTPSANVAGFGGATDGIIDDGVADATYDIGVVLQLQPAAPANVAASVVPTEQSGDSCFCTVKLVDHVVVEWTATSLGADFARYEVERLEEDSGTWELVAVVVSEDINPFLGTSVNKWTDLQVPRNRAAQYRVRVVATSGAVSEWVTTEFVTPQSYGCEVIFTSNADPSLTLVYDREPRVRMLDMNNASNVLARIYGAYGHVSFAEQEDRGVALRMRIVANFGRQPTDDAGRDIGAEAVFEPLRRVARAMSSTTNPVPYVCVLDYEGNRRFARLELEVMDYENPGWRYHADVDVTPLTLTNGAVTVGA